MQKGVSSKDGLMPGVRWQVSSTTETPASVGTRGQVCSKRQCAGLEGAASKQDGVTQRAHGSIAYTGTVGVLTCKISKGQLRHRAAEH
jgi:hypothetical protein